jgi:MFS family permease
MSGFYYYTYTLMQIPAGLMFDRFNVRDVIVIPLLICALGAITFSLAHSIVLGSLGRLMMGAGSAFAFIAVLVVASDLFHHRHFALLAGLTQMLAAFGAMLGEGPLLPLMDRFGWRGTMELLAGTGILLAIIIWGFVRYEKCNQVIASRDEEASIGILYSLKDIARSRTAWLTALYACCLWAPMAAFASLWGVPFLQTVYHATHAEAAGLVMSMWLGLAIGSPILGWISDRLHSRLWPLVFSAAIGLMAFFFVVLHSTNSFQLVAVFLFCAGAACSGQALSFAVVRDHSKPKNLAAAIGFNNMAVVIAGAIFQPLIGGLIGSQTAHEFQMGVSIILVGFLLGILLPFWFVKQRANH